jgi:hypothetical protein
MYSPRWLFFYPSVSIFLFSFAGLLILLTGTQQIFGLNLDIHTLTFAGAMVVVSYQLLMLAIFVRIFSINQGLFPAKQKHLAWFKYFTLERGIAAGIVILAGGIALFAVLLARWADLGFGEIEDVSSTYRLLIPSLTLFSLGVITIFSSFFLRILGLNPKVKMRK